MSIVKTSESEKSLLSKAAEAALSRRKFLRYVGVSSALVASTVVISSCKDNNEDGRVNLGSGDTGILNYAYALEQLEAAFYVKVMSSPYSGMTALETEYLTDVLNARRKNCFCRSSPCGTYP